jgi:two-component system, chemotaxis family, protein-glutamate methylesterase/glutaminase
MAASTGGLAAVSVVVAALPAGFAAPVVVVVHRTTQQPALLGTILQGRTALPVCNAASGDAIVAGTVYIAPPSRHLIVRANDTFAFADVARVNHLNSAADPLFISAAAIYGRRVVAVVLTGAAHDGAEGARHVKAAGGVVLVQDQATSTIFDMPAAAIATGAVDAVLPLMAIGPALCRLVRLREH